MDALLIVCFNPHPTHFLTRADIFKKPLARWLLYALRMIPVYRIRDGWQSLGENQKTFDACLSIFNKNESIAIFPEGNHHGERRVRPLTKGFARIALGAIQKNPELKISVVPVGLNYASHQDYRTTVSVYFGTAIEVNRYRDNTPQGGANRLRNDLAAGMKVLTTHVEDRNQYTGVMRQLEHARADFLDPLWTNKLIAQIDHGEDLPAAPPPRATSVLMWLPYCIAVAINFIPLLIWRMIKSGIKDPVFIASLRFGIGIFLFPAFYVLVGWPVYRMGGIPGLATWLILAFASTLFLPTPNRSFPTGHQAV